MVSKGRQLHAVAAKEREEGNPLASLTANDQALLAYDEANDDLGFAEAIACRALTLKNYATERNSRRFLIFVKGELTAAVQIARESGNAEAMGLPLYHLAQAYEDLGEFSEAISLYKKAIISIKTAGSSENNVPSFLATMEIHLTTCEYKNGDKTAISRAEAALQLLEKADEPRAFTKHVWVSGGHMRIAEILRKDNPEIAQRHLAVAEKIITSDPQLIIRNRQLELLKKQFTTSDK